MDYQSVNSPWVSWIAFVALFVLGACLGWLLRDGFRRRQPADRPTPPHSADRPSGSGQAARGDLLAAVSHEVHTPLNSLIGYADLLLETPLLTDQREFAVNLRQSAELLVALLGDISDYSRLQNGDLELARTDFDFGATLAEVMDLLAPRANERGLELAHEIDPHLDLRVVADPARTRQVLLNLIGNAIKFTAAGHVVVRVEIQPAAPRNLKCIISDTGCGITPEGQTDLFTKPHSPGSGIVRRADGPGIGLAISRKLVKLMGGQIGVDSRPGHGSDFWLQLPLAADNSGQSKPRSKPTLPGDNHRVLLVEATGSARQMVATHLTSAGYTVEALPGGQAALARLRQSAADGQPFQFVVFSEKLPDLTGRDFAQAVRTDPLPALRSTGLVSLRRQGVRSATNREITLGVVEVVKPVLRANLLLHALRTALTLRSAADFSPTSPAPLTEAAAASPPPVGLALLAEDNELHQRLLAEMLGRLGWSCRLADTGTEAVRLTTDGHYDVILMDCYMPELSGFDATRQIRQNEAASGAASTPIIAVTADVLTDNRDRCLIAGMDDILTKPFRRVELEDLLKRWAPHVRSLPVPVA